MVIKNLSDRALVQKCQQELPTVTTAFAEIVRRYKDYVYGLTFNKLNNREDAEDAVQETFIRIFHGIHKFRMESELKTWITVIAGNVCLSLLLSNKQKFWKYHVLLDGDVDLENLQAMLVSRKEEYNFWRKVGEILKKMYLNYRKVFIFKYFKNFSIKDISEKIRATIAAAKMRIKRAKDQFIWIFVKHG